MRLNRLRTACTEFEYPLSKEALLEGLDADTLELAGGDVALETAVERAGEERFESPTEVFETVLTGVPGAGVGRRHYSDRDAPGLSEDRHRQLSF